VHALRQQRVVDLPHAHAGMLLHPFDRGLRGQPAVDGLVDPPAPAFVIGEHLVGLEHFLMLAADSEFRLAGHLVDLVAHLVERRIDAVPFGFGILRHRMLDLHPGLMKDRMATGLAFDQLQAAEACGAVIEHRSFFGHIVIDKFGTADQFRQHHCCRFKGLDLHFGITAGFDMLGAQHPDRLLVADDGYAGEAVEFFFAGFGPILEVRVARCLVEIQRLDIFRDIAGQALAEGELGDMDGFRIEAAGGK